MANNLQQESLDSIFSDLSTQSNPNYGRRITRRKMLELLGLGGVAYAATNLFSHKTAFGQALQDTFTSLLKGPVVGSVDALLKFQNANAGNPATEDMLVELVQRYDLQARRDAYAGKDNSFLGAPYMRDRADKKLGGKEFETMKRAAIEAVRNHADPLYRENADALADLIGKSNLIVVRQVEQNGQRGSAFEFYHQKEGGIHQIPAPDEIKDKRKINQFTYITFDTTAKIVEPIKEILPSIEDQTVSDPLVKKYIEYTRQLFDYGKENRVVMTPQKFMDMRSLLRGNFKSSWFGDSILKDDVSEPQSIRKLLEDDKIKGRNRKALERMRDLFEDSMEQFAAPQSVRMAIERNDAYIGFTGPTKDYADKLLHLEGRLSDLKASMIAVSGKTPTKNQLYKEKDIPEQANYRALIELMNFENQPVSIPVTNRRIDAVVRDKVAYQYPSAANGDLKLGAGVYKVHDGVWNYPGVNSKTIQNALDKNTRDDIKSIWFIAQKTVNEVVVPYNPLYRNNSF